MTLLFYIVVLRRHYLVMIGLDPEEKLKRIHRLMERTKEEIATQWITFGTGMKEKNDKLKIEFIEYKMANDISRFFEDIRIEKSNEVLGSKIRSAIHGNIFYKDWLKMQEKAEAKSKKNSSNAPQLTHGISYARKE